MQWWYVITAEQWSALGTMVGGVAQVGLVGVTGYVGRQWIRQKRYEGVKELIEEFAVIHHEMQKAAADLTHHTDTNNSANWRTTKDAALMAFDNQRIRLLYVAVRCQLYDDELSANVYKVNDFSNVFRMKYLEYRSIPIGEDSWSLGEEERATNDKNRRALAQVLFVPESELWTDYAQASKACYLRARVLMWGN
jgi:hypothetical protein